MITRVKSSSVVQGLPKYRSMLAGNDAYLPSSYESIASATGNGSVSSLTFSSIPSTYTSLQIRGIARGTRSFTTEQLYIRFNSDSGNNYANHGLYGEGGSAVATGSATTSVWLCGEFPAASIASSIFQVGIYDIHDYASTTRYKTGRSISGWNSNSTNVGTQYANIWLSSGLWMNTNAITSITILSNGAFTSDTTFALYGIKGA